MNNIDTIKQFLSCESYDCFKNNRFNDSFTNNKVYHVSYRGLSIEQRPDIIYPFSILLNKIEPNTIIEIGTFAGALSLILYDLTDKIGSKIITYDINSANYLKDIVTKNNLERIKVITQNIFSDNYGSVENTEIEQLISDPNNKILLLCDGGCKKCEFNLLSKYLKPGDIIMAHDYSPNKDYFDERMLNKIWNWHEIQNSDIEDSIQKYNLQTYMKEEFLSVAWACFKKL
jgi:cephalosporin hydroxylase